MLTTAGDTLLGRVEFHQRVDQVVVFGQDGTVRALSAARVRMFAVQGEREYFLPYRGGRVQGSFLGKHPTLTPQLSSHWLDSTTVFLFRAYPLTEPDRGGRSSKMVVLFEQLSNGPYLLLRRQKFFTHPVDAFYILDPQGRVNALQYPQKDILALFSTQARQLEDFASQQHLHFTDAHDLARIITYANNLLP